MNHNVTVKEVNGRHRCDPTVTNVKGGDEVHWGSQGAPIFFTDSPFEEGEGPIDPGKNSVIKKGRPKGKHFHGEVRAGGQSAPVEGEIIVVDPG